MCPGVGLGVALFLLLPAGAQESRELVVVTKLAEPFSMQEADGTWTGLSIELWEEVARRLDLTFRYQEATLEEMLDRVEVSQADVAVAALTVTSDREARMDFTHPYLSSGLGIAVKTNPAGWWKGTVLRMFSFAFLQAVGALLLILLAFGLLIWLVERRRNPEQFGGSGMKGLLEGLWWSAVTMTTVGYGDRAPITGIGRAIAVVWMFASVIVISGFTGAIASSLTMQQLESRIQGPEDLPGARIGSVEASTSADWLRSNRLSFQDQGTVREGIAALARGELDAVVYDAPMLQYLIATRKGLQVLPKILERQDYAFAVPRQSGLRESLNRALIEILTEPRWQQILSRYLGD
jgi:ABC-type amino acid transport substrate-binding protein